MRNFLPDVEDLDPLNAFIDKDSDMEKLAAIVMGNLVTMSAQVLHHMDTDKDPSRVTEELAENVVIFDAPVVEDVNMEEKLQPSTLEHVVEDENMSKFIKQIPYWRMRTQRMQLMKKRITHNPQKLLQRQKKEHQQGELQRKGEAALVIKPLQKNQPP